jgi:two-component system sensor histidine kinase BaeS
LAVVGVVALALVLSGVGTLLLVRRSARLEVRDELVRQADELAVAAEDPVAFRSLATATRALKLEGLSRITFARNGVIVDGALPEGISLADLRLPALRSGAGVSGLHGSLAYAAVGARPPAGAGARTGRFVAIVLTRRADTGLDRGAGWLLLSSLVALAVAAVVADRVGRRITAPVLAAEAATRRIAGGDLSTEVVVPSGSDPELVSLAASINEMAASLGRARSAERQFLLAVSHDLRTPLTSIRGFAEAIADDAVAVADHARAAAVIEAEAQRLERLVADLLELAKLDARRFSLDVRVVDVAEVVGVTAEGFRPELEKLGLALKVDLGGGDSGDRASADPDRLSQVVANLVENALKFASSEVRVVVDGAGFSVRDDGPGIAAGDLDRVFDRFTTSDRSGGRRAAGTGLGLAIVAELVAAMGGTVRATSDGRSGTTIEVRLRPA